MNKSMFCVFLIAIFKSEERKLSDQHVFYLFMVNTLSYGPASEDKNRFEFDTYECQAKGSSYLIENLVLTILHP